jgi:hypothetical protein
MFCQIFRHNLVSVSNFLRGIVFVIAFLPFHFRLLYIGVDRSRNDGNFEFLKIVFKCLGGLRLF